MSETWTTDHDLWGGIRIARADSNGSPSEVAVWSVGTRGRTASAWAGRRGTALHAFFLATSRLPAHIVPGLEWADRPGADLVHPAWRRALDGLLLPFTGPRALELRYAAREESGAIVITARGGALVYETTWQDAAQPRLLVVRRNEREILRAEAV